MKPRTWISNKIAKYMGMHPDGERPGADGTFSNTNPEAGSEVTTANTQQEVGFGEKENKGYKTFSLKEWFDNLRVTGKGKDFGEVTQVTLEDDKKLQEETDVKNPNRRVGNPFEVDSSAIVGAVTMPFISDLHRSTESLVSNRTYTISEKEGKGLTHIVYKIMRFFEKAGYFISELKGNSEIRTKGYQKFIEILPAVLECEQDKLLELSEKLKSELGDNGVFKTAWNRAIVFRRLWSDPETNNDFRKTITEEENQEAKEKYTIQEFREKKIWEMRNKAMEILVPRLLDKHLGGEQIRKGKVIAVDGGDVAHDGGVLEDHIGAKTMLMKAVSKLPFANKFLASIGGNHDQDAREPKSLLETFKYYGERVFYQEVKPETDGGKENLIVGLNTFVMSEEWEEVFNKYLEKNEEELNEDQRKELNEMKASIIKNQEEVFNKMATFEGNCIVVHAHNSRRFMEYIKKKDIKFKPNVQIMIISGHTHEDDNYRILVDKPTDGESREVMEIYKSSAMIMIDGKKLRMPKGLIVEIDEKGEVKVKSMEYEEEDKRKFSEAIGMEVY